MTITSTDVQGFLQFVAGTAGDEGREQPTTDEIDNFITWATDDVTCDILRAPDVTNAGIEKQLVKMRIDHHYHQWFKSRLGYAASMSTDAGSVSHLHEHYLLWNAKKYKNMVKLAILKPYLEAT